MPDLQKHKIEAWDNEDGDAVFVWGTHDPERAQKAFLEYVHMVGQGDEERPAPAFTTAQKMWIHPAAYDIEDEPWPRSFESREARDGWVPCLLAEWTEW